jgi:hypothetical protein
MGKKYIFEVLQLCGISRVEIIYAGVFMLNKDFFGPFKWTVTDKKFLPLEQT